MTQDQCLNNSHQAAGSSHSANDKTSDDGNISNNSTLKSGINTAQEFNVDVNSKRIDQQSADIVIVRNFGVDTDRPIENSLGLASNFVDPIEKLASNATNNNAAGKMTVITHQNSGENIREIVLHPDELNKITNNSQFNTQPNQINKEKNSNKSNSEVQNTSRSKSEITKYSESELKPEDSIERLNKLRASISSALSEVKGVLKQYSTEQSFDGESESSQSSKPADDSPVRFRFVRKIRRRSIFSEENSKDGETVTFDSPSTCCSTLASNHTDAVTKSANGQTISHNLVGDTLTPNAINDNKGVVFTNDDATVGVVPLIEGDKKENGIVPKLIERGQNKANQPVSEKFQASISLEKSEKDNFRDAVNEKVKTGNENSNLKSIQNEVNASTKIAKPKKNSKNDRRASVTLEKTSPQLDLKPQRRPSDSGTIIKHPTRTKPKLSEKQKPTTSEIGKKKLSNKVEPSVINKLQLDAISDNCKNSATGSAEKLNKDSRSITDNINANSLDKKPNIEVESSDLNKLQVDAISENCENSITSTLSKPHKNIKIDDQTVNLAYYKPINKIETGINNLLVDVISDNCKNSTTSSLSELKIQPSKITANSIKVASSVHDKLQVEAISDSKQDSTTGGLSVPNKDINNPTDNMIANSVDTKIVSHISDSLEVNDLLESNISNLTTLKEKSSEITEEVSKVFQTSNQSEQQTKENVNNCDKLFQNAENNQETESGDNSNPPSLEEIKLETKENSKPITEAEIKPVKQKKKAKRKVVIRRIKRKLSKDDTFIHVEETPAELEIEEKEIEEQDVNDSVTDEAEIAPKQPKSCIKARIFEIGDIVMYAERYRKTQVKWRKAKIIERITSISYKLDIDGEQKPAHISYIKKFTDRKVNFGGKEYLEIDYAQIEEDEEKERNYSIWNLV